MKSWMIALALLGCSSASFTSEPSSGQKGKDLDAKKVGDSDGETNDGKVDLDGASDSNQPSIVFDGDSTTPPKVPQFGLLVNDLQCSFCHLKINGDIASTSDVPPLWPGSYGHVNGTWFISGDFNGRKSTPITSRAGARTRLGDNIQLNVSGGIKPREQSASALPKNKITKKPEFPMIDFAGIAGKMRGRVKTSTLEFQNIYNGNIVLIGTDSNPIELAGEVLINGDLVIKGRYKGMANIYVTGNIYIPSDLVASESPFPYSEDPTEAIEQAKVAMANNLDALALATPQSIIVSDFDSHGPGNSSVFDHEWTPESNTLAALGVNNVYNWFPGGKTGFAGLFESYNLNCNIGSNRGDNQRSLSRIDAYLYAAKAIGGRTNLNSYAINGGVIANHFHIISAAAHCPDELHPKFALNARYSYVNYDWRMKVGLLLLKQLEDYFDYQTVP